MKNAFFLSLFLSFSNLFGAIHVIGDSHSCELRGIPNCIEHYLGPVTMHRIGQGRFETTKLNITPGETVIFAFGEIDVRCHIGRQRDLKNRDLNEIIYTLASNYLHQIVTRFPNIIPIVYSITPPTDIINNPAFPIHGSIEDRVRITKLLNHTLKSLCQTSGIEFLDVYDDYADENGVLCVELSDRNVHIRAECNGAIRKKLLHLLEQRNK